MNTYEKESLAAYVIDLAKKYGANEISIDLSEDREFGVQFSNGEIEQLNESQQSSLSVNLYCQHKFSSHSTNNLNIDALKGFIEKAVHATFFLTADKFRELPDSKYYPAVYDIDLKLFDPTFDQVKIKDRIDLVKEIYETSRNVSDRIISVAAGYADTIYSNFKVHSNGFSGHTCGTTFSVSAEVSVVDNDSRPEDWYSVQTRFRNNIPDAAIIGRKAVHCALRRIGQGKIKSGHYNMLVENRAARRLISMLISPMAASAIQQKSSYMDGMIGNTVASKILTLQDHPLIPGGLGSKIFDDEGIAAKERTVIENGVLQQYYVDNYYSKKLGIEPNGGMSSNLLFTIGNQSLEEIITCLKKGILITGFNGGDFNSTTGDFSFGVSGCLIEKGQLIKPINEMNVAGNAKTFWKKLIQLGDDPYPYSKWQVPSLLFEDVYFSGL
ncbi:MAG: TldD/PmbA family protein [Desulfuromonadaceae bacterium]